MKKLIVLLAVLVMLAVGGWAGFWFHMAGKVESDIAFLQTKLDEALAEAKADGVNAEFKLGDITVDGFPLAMNVNFQGMAGTIEIPGAAIQHLQQEGGLVLPEGESGMEPLVLNFSSSSPSRITADLFNPVYRWEATGGDSLFTIKGNGLDVELSAKEKKGALVLTLTKSPFDFLMEGGKPYPADIKAVEDFAANFLKYFRGISIESNGVSIVNKSTNKSLMSYDNFILSGSVNTADGETGTVNFKYKIDNASISGDYYRAIYSLTPDVPAELTEFIVAMNEKVGASSGNIDISYTGPLKEELLKQAPPIVEVSINQFALACDLFGFSLDGKISTVAEEPFPNGYVRIRMTNYKELISLYVSMYNEVLIPMIATEMGKQDMSVAMPKVEQRHLDIVYTFFERMGATQPGGSEFELVVKREAGAQDVQFNSLSMGEAMAVAQEVLTPLVEEFQAQAEEMQMQPTPEPMY